MLFFYSAFAKNGTPQKKVLRIPAPTSAFSLQHSAFPPTLHNTAEGYLHLFTLRSSSCAFTKNWFPRKILVARPCLPRLQSDFIGSGITEILCGGQGSDLRICPHKKASGGIGLRPPTRTGQAVRPLPRGEGRVRGNFTLSPTLSIRIRHSAPAPLSAFSL
jgi:hypothetical protein